MINPPFCHLHLLCQHCLYQILFILRMHSLLSLLASVGLDATATQPSLPFRTVLFANSVLAEFAQPHYSPPPLSPTLPILYSVLSSSITTAAISSQTSFRLGIPAVNHVRSTTTPLTTHDNEQLIKFSPLSFITGASNCKT